jgi:hypothetical protein
MKPHTPKGSIFPMPDLDPELKEGIELRTWTADMRPLWRRLVERVFGI